MKRHSKFFQFLLVWIILTGIGMTAATGCSRNPGLWEGNEGQEALQTLFPGGQSDGTEKVMSAEGAKQILMEGNLRYSQGNLAEKDLGQDMRRILSETGQSPLATIVSCSDSRVPPEIIFDQGLGDLFVVRGAGHVVDTGALGSIEYGAEHLGTPLIVVLGHEKCGAVKATVDGGEVSENIASLIEAIKPAYDQVQESMPVAGNVYEDCADQHIRNTLKKIMASPVISHLVEAKQVQVLGAKYDVDTGEVELLAP